MLNRLNRSPEEIASRTSRTGPNRVAVASAAILASFLSVRAMVQDAFAQGMPTSPAKLSEVSPEETKVKMIEAAIAEFARRILPLLDAHVESEEVREKIRRAFGRIAENSKNPGRLRSHGIVPKGQERGFSYEFRPYEKFPAGFKGLTRTVSLPDNFDPADIGDILFLIHEVIHVEHDDELRRTVNWQRYEDFWNVQTPLCIVDHEVDGVSAEMELLNASRAGQVKTAAREGRRLDIPARRPKVAANLASNAQTYFRGGEPALRSFVDRVCRNSLGARLYTPGLMPVP